MASCYNNRGFALADKGQLDESISDYGRAIKIYKQLVENEGRLEFRSNLESCLFNRAVARSEKGQWKEAGGDIEKGVSLLKELIDEGQRHIVGSFMQAAGFACALAKELEIKDKAAGWANLAMEYFLEEVEGGRVNIILLKYAAGFADGIWKHGKELVKNGLNEKRLTKFMETLGRIIDNTKNHND